MTSNEPKAPTYNRLILTGVIRSSKVVRNGSDFETFRFVLGTRRLSTAPDGNMYLGWDWHFCTIRGPKQCAKAYEDIRRGAWVTLEGNIKYIERDQRTENYKRDAWVLVEYWQLLKPAGADADLPTMIERASIHRPPKDLAGVESRWDERSEMGGINNDQKETRS